MVMKTTIIAVLTLATLWADVRVGIRLGAGHPVRRQKTVVVRRAPVVTTRTVVYSPVVSWSRATVVLPPKNRLVFEDSETLARREDWVDSFLPVNNTGDALFLRVQGRVEVDFAEVHFRNGPVQVVDFNEADLAAGTYRLHDFPDGRYVEHVRLVARARSQRATVGVLMKK